MTHQLATCHACNLVSRIPASGDFICHCPRCGAHLHRRKPAPLVRTWLLVSAAIILYLPANLLPIMTVIKFGREQPNTIVSGVKALINMGMWPIAILVFVASVVVPLLKLVALTWLLISVQLGVRWGGQERIQLYRIVAGIGRWSMVDIYILTVLAALVKFSPLATIQPGAGANFFAAVVILTTIAAETFDPRLIWDRMENPA